jgi:hypothetical protein
LTAHSGWQPGSLKKFPEFSDKNSQLSEIGFILKKGYRSPMDTPLIPQPTPMPIFILFDTQTGYLYGHLFATGPEDPFLQEVIQWWSHYCSNTPIGVDYPGVTKHPQPAGSLSSN